MYNTRTVFITVRVLSYTRIDRVALQRQYPTRSDACDSR